MRLLLLLCCLYSSLYAQNTFNIRTHLNHPSAVFCGVHATDTGYFVSGIVSDSNNAANTGAFIGFWDTIGQIQWLKTLVTPNNTYETWTNSLIPLPDGFVVPGYRHIQGLGMKGIIIKYLHNGDTAWTSSYFSPYGQGEFIRPDNLTKRIDKKGYYLNSTIQNPNNLSEIENYVIKVDTIGNLIWDNVYGTNLVEQWPFIYEDTFQSILISFSTSLLLTLSNYQLRHQWWWLDSLGNITSIYATPNIKPNTTNIKWQLGVPKDLIKTKDGGWLVATGIGTENVSPPVNEVYFDAYLYKLDSNKTFEWDLKMTDFGPGLFTEMVRIFESEDSSLMVIGTYPFDVNGNPVYGGILAKVSPQGDSLWARKFYYLANNGVNLVYDARQTTDGGYVVCGESRSFSGGTPQQGWLLKLDSMGCLVPGCHITAVDVVQTPDAGKIDIKVFPNPAVDYINVYVPRVMSYDVGSLHAMTLHYTTLQLHLYDLNGRLLQNHTLPQSDATYMLTTEGLASGLYLLQVLDGEGRVLGAEKVVVRK